MSQVCPISFQQVNEKGAQMNAVLTIVFMFIFLFSPAKWIILFLAGDFLVRGFFNQSYSAFSIVGGLLLRYGNVAPVMVNAGPKLFAAKIGFIFVSLIGLTWFFDYQKTAVLFAAVLVLFAVLEAVFKFCVACKVYPLLRKLS
jgi:hypothetical protein